MATLDQLTDQHTKLVEQYGFELEVEAHPPTPTFYRLTRDNPNFIGNSPFPQEMLYNLDEDSKAFVFTIDVDFEELLTKATSGYQISETQEYLHQLLDLDRELTKNGGVSNQNFDGNNAQLTYHIPARDETETARLGMFLKRLNDYLNKM